MLVRIEIDTSSAAFGEDAERRADEVARILHTLATDIRRTERLDWTLADENGDQVGTSFTEEG